MAKILITGGAGFIGSNLCDHLLSKGHKVICMDNLSTGHERNISFLRHDGNFTFIHSDIRDLEACREAMEGCNYVLHQAALGSVPRSIKDPITSNKVNVDGFLNILIAARDEGVNKVVYAASSSTYGDSEKLPKVEDEIGRPLSPYAITKFVNELYADVFHRTYGLNTIGLRYFNVFGRRQDPNGAYAAVIPKFTKQFMDHESPVINGDGTYSRDFTYIDNVLQINELAMMAEDENALNQVYNTAVGERTDLNTLARTIREKLALHDPKVADIEIKHGPKRVGDIPHSLASIDKAKALLGYEPQYNLSEGLSEAIEWYVRNL